MGPASSTRVAAQAAPVAFRSLHAPAREASGRPNARGAVPPESIAFLAGRDLPPGAILEAAAQARWLRVSAPSQIIASGALTDDQYYAALARHLGLRMARAPGDLGPAPPTLAAARAGAAWIADGQEALVLAPEGHALDALFNLRRAGALPRDRIVLTAPRRFSAWVRRAAAAPLAAAASEALPRAEPALSAASGMWRGQKVALAGLLPLVATALVFAPGVWFALAQCLALVMLAGVALRLFATAASDEEPPSAPPLADADLPVYTIIAPLYREADIAADFIAAMEKIDYPRVKLDIKIVLEADDADTLRAFAAMALPARYDIIVAPPGAPRTKPRALNIALPFAKGSLVTVYDAEDEPEPEQLRRAAARLARAPGEVGCLQARLAIDNTGDGWLAALFAVEYAALFDVANPGLSALNLPMPLGGTSNHFRASALRAVGGWDAWNVTEDADLGLRLARFGYRVEALASTTHEEAPARMRAWLAQRGRWQKGWMQTLVTVSREPLQLARDLGPFRATCALLLLAAGVFGPLLGPFGVAFTAWEAATGDLLAPASYADIAASTLWCSSFVFCLASILAPALLGIRRRGLWKEARWLPLLPVYYVLMSVAAWRAVIELARDPHRWAKTRHGLARSSRRKAAPAR